MSSPHLEPTRQGIAVIDEYGVVTDDPRPTADAWPNALERPNVSLRLDAALEHRADQAFLAEAVADLQPSLAMELRHAGRSTGAARRWRIRLDVKQIRSIPTATLGHVVAMEFSRWACLARSSSILIQ